MKSISRCVEAATVAKGSSVRITTGDLVVTGSGNYSYAKPGFDSASQLQAALPHR